MLRGARWSIEALCQAWAALCPRKRTCSVHLGMSIKCQNRTSCTAANDIVIPVTSWGSRSKGGVHLAWIKVTKFSDAEYTLAPVFDTGFDR
jgi:hypothetical protein